MTGCKRGEENVSRKTFLSNTLVSLEKVTSVVGVPPQEILNEVGQTLLPPRSPLGPDPRNLSSTGSGEAGLRQEKLEELCAFLSQAWL